MATEVKIGGVTYRAVTDSVRITEQARAVSSTMIQVKLDALPIPVSLQSVEILIDSVAVFSGHIENVSTPEYETGFETRVCTISIQSLEAILNRRLVSANWYNKYVHEIVQDIFDDYLAEEGLTLGSISTTTVQIDSYKKSYEQAGTILEDLARRCDGASWYIAPDKKFYFLLSTDFPQVTAPTRITGLRRVDAYKDLRTVQIMKGASSRIIGTATNATLLAEIAALSGTSGKIEKVESDGSIHNPTKAGTEASARLAQYAEREITLTCTCHDLVKSALYQTWELYSGHFPTDVALPTDEAVPGTPSNYPAGMTGLYTVIQRTITCFGVDQFRIFVTLKNRNYFARYGYSVRQALEDAWKVSREVSNINSEDQFTPDKKIAAREAWNIIASEKDVLDSRADTYSVTTEKTAYDAAFTALANYLNAGVAWASGYPSWIADALLSETTDIVGVDYQATWRAYYDAKEALNAAILLAYKAAIEAEAAAAVPALVSRFRGSFLFVSTTTEYYTAPIVNDWILLFSATPGTSERGIYKWTGTVWQRQSALSEEIVASCAFSVLAAVDAGYGPSTDYLSIGESSQAVDLLIAKRVFAQDVTATGTITGAVVQSNDKRVIISNDGSDSVANEGICVGTHDLTGTPTGDKIQISKASTLLGDVEVIALKYASGGAWVDRFLIYLAGTTQPVLRDQKYGLYLLFANNVLYLTKVATPSSSSETSSFWADYLHSLSCSLGATTVSTLSATGAITTDVAINSYKIDDDSTPIATKASGGLSEEESSAIFYVYKPISCIFIFSNNLALQAYYNGSYYTVENGTGRYVALNPGRYRFINSGVNAASGTLYCIGVYGSTDGSAIWS